MYGAVGAVRRPSLERSFVTFLQTKILKIRKNIQNKQNEPQGQILKRAIAVGIWSVLALIKAQQK